MSPDLIQPALFDVEEWWEDSWKGMPEFVQKDLQPVKTIYVHFEKREHVAKFADLVGQTITPNTRAIWFPEAEIGRFANFKMYVDVDPAADRLADEGIEVLDGE
jgi:hypothetical protein